MEKVKLLPTNEDSQYYQQHIAGRHGKGSMTIGSKLLEDVSDKFMLNLLKETDKAYQAAIDEKGTPGRMVFAMEADRPIGTNAVYPIENLDKSTVFSTIREPGTEGEAKIRVALISEKDMPKTNVAQVIMGHYGPTGNAGIYTMIFGDEGMPFAESVAKRSPDDTEFIAKCQKYWDSHVFLITPEELEANIEQMKAQGRTTKTQELALASFRRREEKSPIVQPYTPEISPNAVKMKMSRSGGVKSKEYE